MRLATIAAYRALKGANALSPAETKLIKAVEAGKDCFLCDRDPEKRTLPTAATDTTRIRADLLRLLITGASKDCGLHERGVTLFGGWIDGMLDLAYCSARGRTMLNFCRFPEKPRLQQARFQLLSLSDSQLDQGLFAQGVEVGDSLFLRSLTTTGTVDVNGAKIGGQLDCTGAQLDGGRDAGGAPQRALHAQGVEVGASLFLSSLTAKGTVAVNGAKIGGQLACDGAQLDGGTDAEGTPQKALHAQGVEVGADLFLRSLTATGTVDVNGAKIGGQLDCEGAQLDGGKDAEGTPQEALHAQRMTVAEGFIFRGVKRVTGPIDLTAAKVGDLVDDIASWPLGPDQLRLDGFTYDRTDGPTSFAARRDWLAAGSHLWGEFRPQPYTQLARVLRQMGHAGEARKVVIERQRQQGIAARQAMVIVPNGDVSVGLRSIWADLGILAHSVVDSLSFLVAGYGQDARRSLWWLGGLLLLATVFANRAWEEGSFAPNSAVILASSGWAEATAADCFPVAFEGCDQNPANTWANTFTASAETPTQGADWDSFNRYGYAFDLVIPVLDLGQTEAWAPSKDRGFWGWVLWWGRWVLAGLGWLVTGIGIAAVTGVMQRNQPD